MKKSKGITLIALVVTIVVLLILAAISISVLTGENGIINNSQQAKEDTEIAEEKETVELSAVQAAGKDKYGNVIEENLREQLDINIGEGDYNLEVEEEKFKVTYKESNRSYYVDKDGNIEIAGADSSSDEDGIYNIPGAKDNIAPTDLFEYEIINDGSIGSTELDNLPTKTAKILRIKQEYCNGMKEGLISDSGETYSNTNYEIIYEGEKISDTLVIPYQVDGKFIDGGIEGEYYKIIEVNLFTYGSYGPRGEDGYGLPEVETIIYPNTVEKINGNADTNWSNKSIKRIVLPKNLKEIEIGLFYECTELTNITIPDSVTSIGEKAFYFCESLTSVTIPDGITSLGKEAFRGCKSLTSITIPNGVTSLESSIFQECSGLTSVTIPSSVTSIGNYAFYFCGSLTRVNYIGTEEEWKQISIGYGNENLTNATINYNYVEKNN